MTEGTLQLGADFNELTAAGRANGARRLAVLLLFVFFGGGHFNSLANFLLSDSNRLARASPVGADELAFA